jgi:hypothetical protein
MTDPRTIADGLSDAQKLAVKRTRALGRIIATGEPAYYEGFAANLTSARALFRLGLTNSGSRRFTLSDLGLAVRAILESGEG